MYNNYFVKTIGDNSLSYAGLVFTHTLARNAHARLYLAV